MQVLVVNAGSSSLKLSLMDGDSAVASTTVERWQGEADLAPLRAFVDDVGESSVGAVGHRVVHGGPTLSVASVIDSDVMAAIEDATDLAPLHQPRSIAAIRATRSVIADAPEVACFDTAFHSSMPDAAATYPIPHDWRIRWPIRKYGFHGLSHAYAAHRGAEISNLDETTCRTISCHLGAGASLAAVEGGRSVDTTMGFTPLDGLMMSTRSGSVDPGLVLWLIDQGMDPSDVTHGLEKRSGIAAFVSSGDMRDLLAARGEGDDAARLGFEIFIQRLRSEIGAMAAAMNGVDLMVFTGGIGERSADVRRGACSGLGYLGVAIEADANDAATADADIGASGAAAAAVVVTAREDIEIARQTRQALSSDQGQFGGG